MDDHQSQAPSLGEKIITNEHGVLQVPDYPIISFVAGTSELWSDASKVIDAAVDKAYEGQRQIIWQASTSGGESCVGLSLESTSNILSLFASGSLLLRHLDWDEAAEVLNTSFDEALQSKIIPQGCELFCECEKVSVSDFCDAVMEHMADEAVFDVDAEQYDALAAKFKEEFESATENTVEIAKKAMEKARKKLTEAGQFTEEKGEKLKEFLENDLSRISQEMKKGAKEKFNPSRLGTGALASISKLLHKTGVALSSFGDKAEASLACKSGEITSAGKLVCNNCGNEMNFKKTGRVPPCPKCHKTQFTKGY
jgi:isocitrate dehydrogenase